MKTIGDMQNENYFYDHCNEFEYNHDFLKFLWKIDDVMEVHLIWDDNVYLFLIDYYKFLLLVCLFD